MVGADGHLNHYRSYNFVDMEITGTREAFEALINQRGIYKLLGVDRSTVSNWKSYLEAGKSISLDKMEEMLIKAGANAVQEKVWDVKNIEAK